MPAWVQRPIISELLSFSYPEKTYKPNFPSAIKNLGPARVFWGEQRPAPSRPYSILCSGVSPSEAALPEAAVN
jgi:hypothetical protein